MDLSDKIISVESGGNADAQNPLSSAGGAGQFIDSTWLDMLAKHRPDLTGSRDDLLALKSDPNLSREMTAAYAGDNAGILKGAGIPVTPGSQYLAHFAGPQGAVGILNADPNAPAASVLGAGFAKANPALAGYSAGQLAAWAEKKMGGSAPMSIAGPGAGAGSIQPSPGVSPQPAQNNAPAAAPATPQSSAPINFAALGATPQLRNILPARPNLFGLKTAPFSLGA